MKLSGWVALYTAAFIITGFAVQGLWHEAGKAAIRHILNFG